MSAGQKRMQRRSNWTPPPSGVELARKRHEAARAAVRTAFTGPDWPDGRKRESARGVHLHTAVTAFETAISIYCTVIAGTPKRYLAVALKRSPDKIRQACAAVETWRGAPLIDDLVERVLHAVPVDP